MGSRQPAAWSCAWLTAVGRLRRPFSNRCRGNQRCHITQDQASDSQLPRHAAVASEPMNRGSSRAERAQRDGVLYRCPPAASRAVRTCPTNADGGRGHQAEDSAGAHRLRDEVRGSPSRISRVLATCPRLERGDYRNKCLTVPALTVAALPSAQGAR